MGRIAETHVAVAIVTVLTVIVSGETHTLMHGPTGHFACV